MSLIPGRLSDAIRDYHNAGHQLAALIIDEQTDEVHGETAAQHQVLNIVQQYGIPVWHVEVNTQMYNDNPPPNDPTTRYLAVPGAHVLTKPLFNAFASDAHPNLHNQLQAANISMLIVMGYATNMCVKATSVGGPDDRHGHRHRPGATQLGYIVLTCDQILRGGQANWKRYTGTRFYDWV